MEELRCDREGRRSGAEHWARSIKICDLVFLRHKIRPQGVDPAAFEQRAPRVMEPKW